MLKYIRLYWDKVDFMKKVLLMILIIMLTVSFCGCGGKGNDTDHNHDHNHSDEILQETDPEEIIKVYLDVKLYKNLLGEEFEFELSKEDAEKGFLTVKKIDDNTAVFTIKRKDFNAFKEGLLSSRKNIFDGYNNNSDKHSVKKVEYNSDITQITVTVDRNIYNPKIFSSEKAYINAYNTVSCCGRNATMYHMYNLGEIEKCTVTVKDLGGNLLETRVYPDKILEELR